MSDTQKAGSAKQLATQEKKGIFARLALFFRQIFAELKKVQRPTQSELWDVFVTVIVFVALVMLLVYGLDAAFSRIVLWVFG
ncbi:MAG: preprotein translocase subunit SecE [Actinomycetaceae bacterium]|nr:preprotein translocase subunit SecE [Actinomycetaceae bacterium]